MKLLRLALVLVGIWSPLATAQSVQCNYVPRWNAARAAARLPMELDASVKSGGNRVGEFKGYVAVNKALRARLLDATDPMNRHFQLSAYFGESNPSGSGLASLLGGFPGSLPGTAPGSEFRNGLPNPLNALLWYIGLNSLARELSAVCDMPANERLYGGILLSERAFGSLKLACDLGALEPAVAEEALLGVWLTTVGYDAPRSSFEAWAAFFGANSRVVPEGKERLAAMLSAAYLDPYFVLEP